MTSRRIPTSIVWQITHLGSTLAQGSEGQCLFCSQPLPTEPSLATLSRVFCSRTCEREYISDNLKSLSPQDCKEMLTRIDALLQSAQAKRSAK